MMLFTRKCSEQEMIFVYSAFLTIIKIFPSVIGRDGYGGNYLRAVISGTHLNVSSE
jgi:hypothetical protein